ncbi:MAG: 5'-methylthioadenosine nucleosidase [Proteobacteria bacterium]|nr:5'-methylthioadenosine nucleosidase [Pseudomonadota bacterium]
MSANALIVIALADELYGVIDEMSVPVLQCGVGKVNAATELARALSQQPVDLVINYGSAGGVSSQAQGLIEIAEVLQRDMNAEPLAPRGRTPFEGHSDRLVSGGRGLVCATGDSFVTANDPWLHDQGVDVVDMELYAIAKVCERFCIPWRAFKYVSDRADENAATDWQRNVREGAQAFVQSLPSVWASR